MARITVEDCLSQVDNRFALIHMAAKRVRALRKGADPLVVCKNEDIVTALREIAEGRIRQAKPALQERSAEALDIVEAQEAPQPPLEGLKAGGGQGDPEAVEKDA